MTSEQSKSDISRARILDAAAKMFRQKGYAATTLIEIARAAGMQAGSLYYHFGSKDELLEEVLDIGMRRVHEAVEESQERLPADSSHRDRIRVAVEAHLPVAGVEQGVGGRHVRHGEKPVADDGQVQGLPGGEEAPSDARPICPT